MKAALARVWGPLRVQTAPVAGIEVQFVTIAGQKPQWQFISSGLLAMAGAEVAFRLVRKPEELTMPGWVEAMFQSLVERAGSESFTEGQVIRFAQKLGHGVPELDTDMQAVALGIDPRFGTPQVLVAVGLTRDEERLVREWSPLALLDVLARLDPTLVTDLERPSTLVSPRSRGIIEQRVASEGSSLGVMLANESTVEGTAAEGVTWSLSVEAVETVMSLLKGRTGHLRPFAVKAKGSTVDVIPADFPSVERTFESLIIKLSQPAARQVRASLKAKPGSYRFEALPKFTLVVVA